MGTAVCVKRNDWSSRSGGGTGSGVLYKREKGVGTLNLACVLVQFSSVKFCVELSEVLVMKSATTVCSQSAGVQSGRIHRQRRDIENEEIQMYLSKLKELVPFMPKNRRLSKLEVIQYVIDYICDLQYALETHPTVNSAVVQASAAAMMRQTSSPTSSAAPASAPRQPLGVLAPNTILSASPAPTQEVSTVSVL